MKEFGTLYIVATPIGNLQDITIRALSVLESMDVIACEDTRRTGQLLKKLNEDFNARIGIKELISYYDQVEQVRIPQIINALKNGLSVALVSDAGTPLVSDPGFKLVRECRKEGIKVESIPGPSAVTSALVVSGLPTDKFFFAGYPPQKSGHRQTFFENIKKSSEIIPATVILYEAPHKLIKTLEDIKQVIGDREITLARELTKIYEEVKSDLISDHLEQFKTKPPKGEYVVLFHL